MTKLVECGIFQFGKEVATQQARSARAGVNQPFTRESPCVTCGGNCKATISPGNHILMDEANNCILRKPPFKCGARLNYEAYRVNEFLHASNNRIPIMDNTRGAILSTCWRCGGQCGFENRTGTDLKMVVPGGCMDGQMKKRAEQFNNRKKLQEAREKRKWKRH